jgi:hypothetical protein
VDRHAVRIASGVLVDPKRLTFVVDPVQHRSSDSVGIIECVRVALDRVVGEAMGYVRRGDLIEADGDCRVIDASNCVTAPPGSE